MRFAPALILLALLTGGAACQPEPHTANSPLVVSWTPDPTPTAPSFVTPGPSAAAPPATAPTLPLVETDNPAVRYRIEAALDWEAHTAEVTQHVAYVNDTDAPLKKLVLNVETNQTADQFALEQVVMDSGLELESYTLDGARLTIPLPQALSSGDGVGLTLAFTLTIPPIQNGYSLGHLGYFGYSERQVNLGNWFPQVAVLSDAGEWISPQPHTIGEQTVLRMADYDVALRVIDGPEGLQAAGPGVVEDDGAGRWTFTLEAARELTISLSPQFHMLETTTSGGVQVELYYLADLQHTIEAPRHALRTAADAIALYAELYGQPCPFERLVVVEGDFPDGMEFSGLVFVSKDWFLTWQGIPNDWLTLITAHEIAHQWWYSAVGSDQGNTPYLDEALAIYSEALFFEHVYPDLLPWWWDFRVIAYAPAGYVDSAVYDFHTARGYINAIYLQGARMMQSLREDLGDEAFFAWLQRYAAAMCGAVATPDDFWGAMTDAEYAATFETRQAYLRRVSIRARPSDLP